MTALQPHIKREVMPADLTGTDLEAYIRDAASTYWHQVGTAKMGNGLHVGGRRPSQGTRLSPSLDQQQRRYTHVAPVRHLSRVANMLQVDARTRILEAAASLLAESPERDISTRAVCEAANVGAPMLYRLFGDKNGLLAAVVDYRFGRYMTDKRNRPPAADPVDDLYVAWDNHVAFALENPTIYRIVYSPSLAKLPAAADEAHRLLVEWMDRCAEAGKLKLPPDVAAQAFTAACVGVTLSLLSAPDIYDNPDLSDRVRDAIIRDLIVETGDSSGERDTDFLKPAAVQMAALLRRTPTPLSEPEVLMMLQWLNTISTADQVQDSPRIHSARNASMSTRRRAAAPTAEDATNLRVR